tara:strand:- start:58 stop:321 length:264 start_codon:yes stop_codon:yes gene_type:complete
MGSSPIVPTIYYNEEEMTWTIIYREHGRQDALSTEVIHGPWGEKESMRFASSKVNGDVLAIVAGDQVVYFNNPVVSSLYDMRNNQKP